jgi:hypothetical protein
VKIGLDFHGVITENPKLFSQLSKVLCRTGHEVHIITGSKVTSGLLNKLKEFDIEYTHMFSIVDYHEQMGTEITEYENNTPRIEDKMWDRTKAQYCKENNIDLHIDDSPMYGRYFTTPFALFN